MQVRLGTALIGAGIVYATLPLAAEIPRTDDGKPDFSGTYDITSLTRMERDPRLGERLTYTVEEIEEMKRVAHSRVDEAVEPLDPDRESLKALEGEARDRGVDNSGSYTPGSYDWHWFDCGGIYCDYYMIDGEYRTSIIVDPPNGRRPPLSEAGKARRATLRPYYQPKYPGEAWWLAEGTDPYDNPEGLSIGDRCLYMSLTIPATPSAYNNMKTVVQTDDEVLIMVEWMHWPRVVRMDSEHLPADMISYGGDSIGWWEGDTLVVETTNFKDYMGPHDARPDLRIVERFSPIDADSVLYNFTVHDPDYEAPYTGEFPWTKSDKRLYEYACHEGNYSMANTLSGARYLEAKWIEEHGEPQAGEAE
ncbi:MAG: hypothetical protein OXG82_17470 [Gammaproteobacteria bacterium]|nr:hypothetical protein [Gammaproteobacteria bacterium]